MEGYYRPTAAVISLDALRANVSGFRSRLAPGMRLLASVKANAYGHGAVWSARTAAEAGADYLGVAFLDEALQLRDAGIDTPLLVLGLTPSAAFPVARERGIAVTLYREDQLDAIERMPVKGAKLQAHVKIDSGMGRLGLLPGPSAERFLERAFKLPQLAVEGMYTHYAKADESNKSYTMMQAERFASVVDYVRRASLPVEIIHAGNTAAGIDLPPQVGGMLRLGIGMYGLYPSDEVRQGEIPLAPVMSLRTRLAHVKTLAAGEGISYGTRYFTEKRESIGTLPVGYADGFSRMLSGKAEVLARGRRHPVVGSICMDQCMVRLEDAPSGEEPAWAPDEEVVLFGRQGEAVLPVEELAAKLGTINYEVTCMVAARVPRVYVSGGEIVSVVNPLLQA
ncbi:alanine racemase [Cohnella sp. JJ-181]|uniref:alanine racemase n=1 Tax=Cohnella rhizoplanae TaxID=2974897 RepID=UPI0022FF8F11|nr:alanine racemase [Cohnella sp. JJ-181]CAI6085863.1 Alanine racemase [Cohnella sp. JJ-181]